MNALDGCRTWCNQVMAELGIRDKARNMPISRGRSAPMLWTSGLKEFCYGRYQVLLATIQMAMTWCEHPFRLTK